MGQETLQSLPAGEWAPPAEQIQWMLMSHCLLPYHIMAPLAVTRVFWSCCLPPPQVGN